MSGSHRRFIYGQLLRFVVLLIFVPWTGDWAAAQESQARPLATKIDNVQMGQGPQAGSPPMPPAWRYVVENPADWGPLPKLQLNGAQRPAAKNTTTP
jgi:hypothetical protein